MSGKEGADSQFVLEIVKLATELRLVATALLTYCRTHNVA